MAKGMVRKGKGDVLGKKGPSQRQLRVAQSIRGSLCAILSRGEVFDPGFPFEEASVTEVVVGGDLKSAKVYVRHLRAERMEELVALLKAHKGKLRHALAPRLGLRYVPDLSFFIDTTLDYALEMEALFQKPEVRQDLEKEERE